MSPQQTILQEKRENTLVDWREKEKKALELLQITGELRFDRSIELIFFREDIYDARPSEVLHLHRVARNFMDSSIPVEVTLDVDRFVLPTTTAEQRHRQQTAEPQQLLQSSALPSGAGRLEVSARENRGFVTA